MFHQARIKLTAWYLLIIMLISIFFSAAIYRVLTSELDRLAHSQRMRLERQLNEQLSPFFPFANPFSQTIVIDTALIDDAKEHIRMSLLLVNAGILGMTAIVGYFLAGKTLRPIRDMVDEQKRFITDSSHELRTPLTALKSEIEVNLRDKKLTLANARRLLSSNLEEVNNLQKLSDNLLQLAQMEANQNGIALQRLDLEELINRAIKKVQPLAKQKDITIKIDVKPLTVRVEPTSFVELLVILLDNAIKYSPKQTQVTLSSRKTDGQVQIKVKDQGVGIPKSDIPYVFDRFYRSDKSRTKTDVSGYGLGLSIAKKIVDRHHATINVKSEVGQGSEFTIRIPA